MATAKPAASSKLCQQCIEGEESVAEMYCINCNMNLCLRCLKQHKQIPSLKNHMFAACDSDIPEISDKLRKDLILKDGNGKTEKGTSVTKVSKIFPTGSSLGRMVGGLHGINTPWTVRTPQISYIQLFQNMKLVKTVDNLTREPYRLGTGNNCIYVRSGEGGSGMIIDVYSEELECINQISYSGDKNVHTAQQVSVDDVFVTSQNDLYLFNNTGVFQSKIITGTFSDLSIHNNSVFTVDFVNNKIIELTKVNNLWSKSREFPINTRDNNAKTIHCVNNELYVSYLFSDIIYKYNTEGAEICTYGSGQRSTRLVEFNGPLICGSDQQQCVLFADLNNHRFQLLDPQNNNKWLEFKIPGIEYPLDLILIKNSVYMLHGKFEEEKISKFEI